MAAGAIPTRAAALFAAAELPQCSGQVWIWVVGQETVGVLVVDELAVDKPLDRTAPSACTGQVVRPARTT